MGVPFIEGDGARAPSERTQRWVVTEFSRSWEPAGSESSSRALDTTLGREVALKVPREGRPGRLDRMLLREGSITKALSHPNIVTVYDFICELGEVKVLDFGLARAHASEPTKPDSSEARQRTCLPNRFWATREKLVPMSFLLGRGFMSS